MFMGNRIRIDENVTQMVGHITLAGLEFSTEEFARPSTINTLNSTVHAGSVEKLLRASLGVVFVNEILWTLGHIKYEAYEIE